MNLESEEQLGSSSVAPPAKEPDDTPPQGLAWGESAGRAQLRRPVVRGASEELRGLFAGPLPSNAGSVSALMPPPPPAGAGATGEDPVAQLFATDTLVAAPPIAPEHPSEAELSQQQASQEGDLLHDRLQTAAAAAPPSAATKTRLGHAPATPAGKPTPKATLVGIAPGAAPPAQARASEAQVEDTLELEAVEELPSAKPALRHSAERGRSSTPNVGAGHANSDRLSPPIAAPKTRAKSGRRVEPPPPPPAQKASVLRMIATGVGVVVAGLGVAYAGAWLGFYDLAPEARAIVGNQRGLRGNNTTVAAAVAAPAPAAKPMETVKPAAAAVAVATPATLAAAKPTATAAPKLATKPAAPAALPAAAPAPKPMAAATVAAPHASVPAPQAAVPALAPASKAAVVTAAPLAPAAPPLPTSGDAEQLTAAARARLTGHDAQGAETLARRALDQDRDDHHAMEVLAQALLDQHRAAEALKYAELIIKKRPKRAAYRVLEGDAKLQLGDQEGARSAFEQALTLDPNNRSIQHRLGI